MTKTFRLSDRSLTRLLGVHPMLAGVMREAISRTRVDFGITEGVRTPERQAELMAAGKSQTTSSWHLRQPDYECPDSVTPPGGWGCAVDVVAYADGAVTWEMDYYCQVADAVREAILHQVHTTDAVLPRIRWGGSWSTPDIGRYTGPDMRQAQAEYVARQKRRGSRPFIDAVHFEIRPDMPLPVA